MILLNFIFWFLPPLFVKGKIKYFLYLLSILFSSTYWIPVLLINLNDNEIPAMVVENYIDTILLYSIYSGIFFYFGIFILLGFRKTYNFKIAPFFNIIKSLPTFKLLYYIIKFFIFVSLIYSYIVAFSQIGIGDRVYLMDDIKPFWYVFLLPIISILFLYLIFIDFRYLKNKISFRVFSTLLLLIAFIFLIGFDGSRRQGLPSLLLLFILVFVNSQFPTTSSKLVRNLFIFIFFLFLFNTIMSLNRGFDVGWQIFNTDFSEVLRFKNVAINMILAPTPTLHVNTQMVQYIESNGIQGFGSYFSAIGNTLFPQFIFDTYFFGEPLVSYLHAKFGWYGQDFGFMAEAIYSGGIFGVILIHFLCGLFIAFTIKMSTKGYLFFTILLFGISFGFINSLRSDFMNILKATYYPTITIYILVKSIMSIFYKKVRV